MYEHVYVKTPLGKHVFSRQIRRTNKVRTSCNSDMSLVVRKPVFGVSDQVPHKPGCTATEDGWRLEISYLGRRDIVLSV